MRFVDANVDAMRREWLMYARGLDGERLVALVLNERGSGWHVNHGLKLWQDQDFGRQFTAANIVTFLV